MAYLSSNRCDASMLKSAADEVDRFSTKGSRDSSQFARDYRFFFFLRLFPMALKIFNNLRVLYRLVYDDMSVDNGFCIFIICQFFKNGINK